MYLNLKPLSLTVFVNHYWLTEIIGKSRGLLGESPPPVEVQTTAATTPDNKYRTINQFPNHTE